MAVTTRSPGPRAEGRPAQRQGRAVRSDVRLWAGVALLAVSAIAGALALRHGTESVTAWRATRDLAEGATLSGLEPISVPLDVAQGAYLESETPPQGRLRWPVAAGSLVPRAALDDLGHADVRRVTLPIDPLHAPVDLAPGALVDVWWTAGDGTGAADSSAVGLGPALVRPAALVADLTADALGLGGEIAVVLEVPSSEIAPLVRAARSGRLDLVAVNLADGRSS